ncbi:CDP-alcohol phosphatidyltransferase family protein [Acidobacteriota bacterium]
MKISRADFATMGNGICGLIAIFFILGGRFMQASLLIFLAYGFDGLDGILARRFGSSHRFGKYLDSFSDSISFCIVPVMLFFVNFLQKSLKPNLFSFVNILVMGSLIVFGISGLSRLVRFVRKYHSLDCFRGFPLPLAAISTIMMCSLLGQSDKNPFSFGYQPYVACVLILFLSFIMTSRIGFPKLDRFFFRAAFIGAPFVLIPFIIAVFEGVNLQNRILGILETAGFLPIVYYLIQGPFYQKKKSKREAS